MDSQSVNVRISCFCLRVVCAWRPGIQGYAMRVQIILSSSLSSGFSLHARRRFGNMFILLLFLGRMISNGIN